MPNMSVVSAMKLWETVDTYHSKLAVFVKVNIIAVQFQGSDCFSLVPSFIEQAHRHSNNISILDFGFLNECKKAWIVG